jgi:hypothetical protein
MDHARSRQVTLDARGDPTQTDMHTSASHKRTCTSVDRVPVVAFIPACSNPSPEAPPAMAIAASRATFGSIVFVPVAPCGVDTPDLVMMPWLCLVRQVVAE